MNKMPRISVCALLIIGLVICLSGCVRNKNPLQPPEFVVGPVSPAEIPEIVAKISEESISDYIKALQAFGTRYEFTQGREDAAQYIFNQFQSMGLEVEYDIFQYAPYLSRSIVIAADSGQLWRAQNFSSPLQLLDIDFWNSQNDQTASWEGTILKTSDASKHRTARIPVGYLDDGNRSLGWMVGRYGSVLHTSAPLTYDSRNVVATLRGRENPGQIYILGAHYDSYSDDPWNLAPGADDNASGVAGVLEAARVLSQYSFNATIKFIAFSAEELGLLGSSHYASQAASGEENIGAAVILDMIGYLNTPVYDVLLEGNQKSKWLVDTMATYAQSFTGLEETVKSLWSFGSDHVSFQKYGYNAVLIIENEYSQNPHYHTTHDLLSTLTISFAREATKLGVATVATFASTSEYSPPLWEKLQRDPEFSPMTDELFFPIEEGVSKK